MRESPAAKNNFDTQKKKPFLQQCIAVVKGYLSLAYYIYFKHAEHKNKKAFFYTSSSLFG